MRACMALSENNMYFMELYYQNERITLLREVVQGMEQSPLPDYNIPVYTVLIFRNVLPRNSIPIFPQLLQIRFARGWLFLKCSHYCRRDQFIVSEQSFCLSIILSFFDSRNLSNCNPLQYIACFTMTGSIDIILGFFPLNTLLMVNVFSYASHGNRRQIIQFRLSQICFTKCLILITIDRAK